MLSAIHAQSVTCRLHASALPRSVVKRKSMTLLSTVHEYFQRTFWRVGIVIHCHQQPNRSFFLGGRQVPICARCLGVLVGSALVPLYCHNLLVATFLIAAMLLDGGSQLLCLRESTNWLRFITGLGFAFGCGGVVERIAIRVWNI